MKSNTFIPSVLALTISAILTGCGGGGSSSSPDVSNIPTNPGTGTGDNGTGGTGGTGDNGTGGTGGTGDNGTGGTSPEITSDLTIVDQAPISQVKVGVIDSGVDTHSSTLNGAVSKVLKFDYVPGDDSIVTDISAAPSFIQDSSTGRHGTFVSQIIGGKAVNGSTAGDAVGIADIYAAQTTINSAGQSYTSVNFEAMRYLQEKFGVKLFNGSWGGVTGKNADPLTQFFASEVVANGGLIILAAGNEALSQSSDVSQMPNYVQGLEQGFLTVVGLNEAHTDLYYNAATGTGSNECGGTARWCLASNYVNGPYYNDALGTLQYFGGTSGATPTVTSAAALVWSKYPWLTNDQVRQTLLTTADYIDDGSGQQLYNDRFGWGALDSEQALKGPAAFYTLFGSYFEANVDTARPMYVFSNDIIGDAGLDKSGLGTLVLSGNNTYTGDTDVLQGKLVVTGSVSSNVNVGLNGHLTGNGVAGKTVNNSGIVSTGNGALQINGDYNQYESGTLDYTLNKNLDIKGAANLGGTLAVTATDSKYVSKGEHLVLDADGGVNGKFTNVTTGTFLKTNGITYGSQNVKVDVDHADATQAGTNSSSLSVASGEVLNSLFAKADEQYKSGNVDSNLVKYVGNVQTIANALQAQEVLNASNGSLFAATPSVILQNQSMANSQIARRSHALNQNENGGAWVSYAQMEKEANFDGLGQVKSETNTVSVGVDAAITDNTKLGLYTSLYKENSDFNTAKGKNELDLNTLGLYGTWTDHGLTYISGHAYVGGGTGEFDRKVFNGTDFENVKSSSDLLQSGLYGEAGLSLNNWGVNFTPYVGASFNYLNLDGLKENNQYGLTVSDVDAKEAKYHAGLRLDANVGQGVTVGGFAEYANKMGSGKPEVTIESNLASSAKTTYKVEASENDYTIYGLNFNYAHKNGKWNVFADVAGMSEGSDSYQGQVGVKVAF